MTDDQDIPVREALGTIMEIAVVVKENGDFWLVHDREFAGEPGWVEYDRQSRSLSFISDQGHIHAIDLELSAEAYARLQNAETVFLIHMKDGKTLSAIRELPVIIHQEA